ncbi:hypothetical protein GCM10010912_68100 [Paenibacillus albidus]|uniref:Uncharacterized protein n=1 Tax=Paenibacillus albidus TaxID=2041023 RepID=A0A917FYD1_9BACL|nr:hypothetical protein GCM10010912_68100 [Paenibacillus albidus]
MRSITFNKREVLSKETTPLLGMALYLYTAVYFMVKMNFVLRYITVIRTISAASFLKKIRGYLQRVVLVQALR